jgi:hypothetical protein
VTRFRQDFAIASGDSLDIIYSVAGASTLVGASITWTMVTDKRLDTRVTKTLADGITIVVSADAYPYEAQIVDVVGQVSTAAVGTVTVIADLIA